MTDFSDFEAIDNDDDFLAALKANSDQLIDINSKHPGLIILAASKRFEGSLDHLIFSTELEVSDSDAPIPVNQSTIDLAIALASRAYDILDEHAGQLTPTGDGSLPESDHKICESAQLKRQRCLYLVRALTHMHTELAPEASVLEKIYVDSKTTYIPEESPTIPRRHAQLFHPKESVDFLKKTESHPELGQAVFYAHHGVIFTFLATKQISIKKLDGDVVPFLAYCLMNCDETSLRKMFMCTYIYNRLTERLIEESLKKIRLSLFSDTIKKSANALQHTINLTSDYGLLVPWLDFIKQNLNSFPIAVYLLKALHPILPKELKVNIDVAIQKKESVELQMALRLGLTVEHDGRALHPFVHYALGKDLNALQQLIAAHLSVMGWRTPYYHALELLFYVCSENYSAVEMKLLRHPKLVRTKYPHDYTIAHFASYCDDVAIPVLLQECGADFDAVNAFGKKPAATIVKHGDAVSVCRFSHIFSAHGLEDETSKKPVTRKPSKSSAARKKMG